ncbi:hypothetical protein H4K36_01105 [Streptomyces sp. DHE7-1]|nr:hypothetical protein [Streptomyces sp. DHE7-1]
MKYDVRHPGPFGPDTRGSSRRHQRLEAELPQRRQHDVDEQLVPLQAAGAQQVLVVRGHEEDDLAVGEPLHGQLDEQARAQHAPQRRPGLTTQPVLERLVDRALEAVCGQPFHHRDVTRDARRTRFRKDVVQDLSG